MSQSIPLETKVLMVCLGNICRSPLAEGILRHKTRTQKQHWQIDSAGTAAYSHVGSPPYPLSIQIAAANNIDISTQRARQFLTNDIAAYDHIYVMDRQNYQDVQHIAKEQFSHHKVSLILDVLEKKNQDVPDPYQKSVAHFQAVFSMLDKACDKIVSNHQLRTSLTINRK